MITPHRNLRTFSNNGNQLMGIATHSLGAKEFEVWRTHVAPGSSTPLHRHGSEEVFVFLRGSGVAQIGDERFEFSAPATVIAPAGIPHQFFNTSAVETDAIVIVGAGSKIYNAAGEEMHLPWRK